MLALLARGLAALARTLASAAASSLAALLEELFGDRERDLYLRVVACECTHE